MNYSGVQYPGQDRKGNAFMATDTQKYAAEREARHSALTEFQRDERRPAVLLLTLLIVAAIFFALGIMVGRWTTQPKPPQNVSPTVRP